MKKALLLMAAAMSVMAMAGAAFAANPTDVTVTATVQDVCTFTLPALGATTIAIGNIDPSSGAPQSGSTLFGAAAKCTKGNAFTATLGTGLNGNNTLDNGTDTIPYTPTYACERALAGVACTGLGFGAGNDIDVRVTVDIAGSDYADVSGGAYSDTFQVTLNP